jgi:hypothetical protein
MVEVADDRGQTVERGSVGGPHTGGERGGKFWRMGIIKIELSCVHMQKRCSAMDTKAFIGLGACKWKDLGGRIDFKSLLHCWDFPDRRTLVWLPVRAAYLRRPSSPPYDVCSFGR